MARYNSNGQVNRVNLQAVSALLNGSAGQNISTNGLAQTSNANVHSKYKPVKSNKTSALSDTDFANANYGIKVTTFSAVNVTNIDTTETKYNFTYDRPTTKLRVTDWAGYSHSSKSILNASSYTTAAANDDVYYITASLIIATDSQTDVPITAYISGSTYKIPGFCIACTNQGGGVDSSKMYAVANNDFVTNGYYKSSSINFGFNSGLEFSTTGQQCVIFPIFSNSEIGSKQTINGKTIYKLIHVSSGSGDLTGQTPQVVPMKSKFIQSIKISWHTVPHFMVYFKNSGTESSCDVKYNTKLSTIISEHPYIIKTLTWKQNSTTELWNPGKTINGWSLTDGGAKVADDYVLKESTTFYALWREINLTMKYYDKTVYKTTTISGFSKVKDAIDRASTTRTGYNLTGWHIENGSQIDANTHIIAEDTTIVADYQIKQFTVTFKDFENRTIKTETVEYGKNATPPQQAPSTNTGVFTGWSNYKNITADTTVTPQQDTITISFSTTPVAFGEVLQCKTPPNDTQQEVIILGGSLNVQPNSSTSGTAYWQRTDATTVTISIYENYLLNVAKEVSKQTDVDGDNIYLRWGAGVWINNDEARYAQKNTNYSLTIGVGSATYYNVYCHDDPNSFTLYKVTTGTVGLEAITMLVDGYSSSDGSGNWNTPYESKVPFTGNGKTYDINFKIQVLQGGPKYVNVTFKYRDSNENWVETTKTIVAGGTVTSPSTPTTEHYTFQNWSHSLQNVSQDMTVTAIYKVKTYTITIHADMGNIPSSQYFVDKDGKNVGDKLIFSNVEYDTTFKIKNELVYKLKGIQYQANDDETFRSCFASSSDMMKVDTEGLYEQSHWTLGGAKKSFTVTKDQDLYVYWSYEAIEITMGTYIFDGTQYERELNFIKGQPFCIKYSTSSTGIYASGIEIYIAYPLSYWSGYTFPTSLNIYGNIANGSKSIFIQGVGETIEKWNADNNQKDYKEPHYDIYTSIETYDTLMKDIGGNVINNLQTVYSSDYYKNQYFLRFAPVLKSNVLTMADIYAHYAKDTYANISFTNNYTYVPTDQKANFFDFIQKYIIPSIKHDCSIKNLLPYNSALILASTNKSQTGVSLTQLNN